MKKSVYFCSCLTVLALASTVGAARAGLPGQDDRPPAKRAEPKIPAAIYGEHNGLIPGEPLAVSIDINQQVFLADGAPSRVLMLSTPQGSFLEFQLPAKSPGFYPTDLAARGFFIYVVDETGRAVLRFDKNGAYRDVLLDFDKLVEVRRVSPYGLGVDNRGRMAVTDVENHQVLLFDGYLGLDVAFGNYGSFAGQFDSPQGVSFTPDGDLVVADTGNKRIQYFSDGGAYLRSVPGEDGPNPFRGPRRAVADRDGTLYVADPPAGCVFVFDGKGNLQDVVSPGEAGSFEPADVEVSVDGLLYVPDVASGKLFVFKVM